MPNRPKIPRKREAAVMFGNDHTCCVCRTRGKDVQIHHIDGDRTNNDMSNLAVLCLDCHSKATGSRGLGRSHSEAEVRKYKRDWEFRIKKERGQIFEPSRTVKRVESKLVKFEIRKYAYEFSATRKQDRAQEILDLFDLYSTFEGYEDYILEQFRLLVPFIDGRRKGEMLVEYVTHCLWSLPGPDDVRMTPRSLAILRKAVEVLAWMGEFHAMIPSDGAVVDSCLRALYEVSETADVYGLRKLQSKIIRSMRSIRKEAQANYHNERARLARSAKRAARYIRKLKERLRTKT